MPTSPHDFRTPLTQRATALFHALKRARAVLRKAGHPKLGVKAGPHQDGPFGINLHDTGITGHLALKLNAMAAPLQAEARAIADALNALDPEGDGWLTPLFSVDAYGLEALFFARIGTEHWVRLPQPGAAEAGRALGLLARLLETQPMGEKLWYKERCKYSYSGLRVRATTHEAAALFMAAVREPDALLNAIAASPNPPEHPLRSTAILVGKTWHDLDGPAVSPFWKAAVRDGANSHEYTHA